MDQKEKAINTINKYLQDKITDNLERVDILMQLLQEEWNDLLLYGNDDIEDEDDEDEDIELEDLSVESKPKEVKAPKLPKAPGVVKKG